MKVYCFVRVSRPLIFSYCLRRVLAQSPKSEEAPWDPPRVCIRISKKARNVLVVCKAFPIWWNQAHTEVSGNRDLTHIGLSSVSVGIKTYLCWICYKCVQFHIEIRKLVVVVHVLQTTQKLVISRYCFAGRQVNVWLLWVPVYIGARIT